MVEALFQQPAALQEHHAPALQQLLPALAAWVPAHDREMGVMATKLLCDLLLVMLWDPACCCYDEQAKGEQEEKGLGTAAVNHARSRLVCMIDLPKPSIALSTNRPIPYTHTRTAGEANELMDEAVQRDVLPLLPQLLRGEDPLPLYALRMLGALLQVAPHWAPAIAEYDRVIGRPACVVECWYWLHVLRLAMQRSCG